MEEPGARPGARGLPDPSTAPRYFLHAFISSSRFSFTGRRIFFSIPSTLAVERVEAVAGGSGGSQRTLLVTVLKQRRLKCHKITGARPRPGPTGVTLQGRGGEESP